MAGRCVMKILLTRQRFQLSLERLLNTHSKKNLQFLYLVGPHSSFSSGEMTKANCKFKLDFIYVNSPTFKMPLSLKTNEQLKKLFARIHISCWQNSYKMGPNYLSLPVFYPNGGFDSRGSNRGAEGIIPSDQNRNETNGKTSQGFGRRRENTFHLLPHPMQKHIILPSKPTQSPAEDFPM